MCQFSGRLPAWVTTRRRDDIPRRWPARCTHQADERASFSSGGLTMPVARSSAKKVAPEIAHGALMRE
jgi:hypothetical protein